MFYLEAKPRMQNVMTCLIWTQIKKRYLYHIKINDLLHKSYVLFTDLVKYQVFVTYSKVESGMKTSNAPTSHTQTKLNT